MQRRERQIKKPLETVSWCKPTRFPSGQDTDSNDLRFFVALHGNGLDYTYPETVFKLAYREGIEPPSLDLESKALPLDERHVTGAPTVNRTRA